MSGQIRVEVDSAPQDNLAEVIAEIREEYEAIIKKNNKALEEWHKQKVRVKSRTWKLSEDPRQDIDLIYACIFFFSNADNRTEQRSGCQH